MWTGDTLPDRVDATKRIVERFTAATGIQVELVGFAKESHLWSEASYRQIADLARWIEKHGGVERICSVQFRSSSNFKVTNWLGYSGHIGHQHVPENDHWDPGLLDIARVLK